MRSLRSRLAMAPSGARLSAVFAAQASAFWRVLKALRGLAPALGVVLIVHQSQPLLGAVVGRGRDGGDGGPWPAPVRRRACCGARSPAQEQQQAKASEIMAASNGILSARKRAKPGTKVPEASNRCAPWAGYIRRHWSACRCAPGDNRSGSCRCCRPARPGCASSSSGRRGSG